MYSNIPIYSLSQAVEEHSRKVLNRGTANYWTPYSISRAYWTYAVCRHNTVKLLAASEASAATLLHTCNARELTTMAWGMAKSGVSSPQFNVALVEALSAMHLRNFDYHNIANLAWATTVLKLPVAATTIVQHIAKHQVHSLSIYMYTFEYIHYLALSYLYLSISI